MTKNALNHFISGVSIALIAAVLCLSTNFLIAADKDTSPPARVDPPTTGVLTAPASPKAPEALTAAATPTTDVRNVAIFVKNKAGDDLKGKEDAFTDMVASRITDAGFSVVSRENVANAVASFAKEGANKGDATKAGADIDAILSNNTSALRLAQNMGADYVLIVSFTTYGGTKHAFDGNGIKTLVVEYKLRVSYQILDKFIGGTLAGDTITTTTKKNRTDVNEASDTDVINDLLDDASTQLTQSLQNKIKDNKIREVKGDSRLAEITIVCGAQDLVVPSIDRNAAGEYVVGESKYRVEAMNVVVTLDGVALGTAPNTFNVAKGLHKLRLSRHGFTDYEGTITAIDKQTFRVDLRMTDAAFARWKEITGFFEQLKAGQKLTDAEVKVAEGQAQMLRQSGYKVDVKIEGGTKGLIQTSLFN